MDNTVFMDLYINQILQRIYASQNLCKLLLVDDNVNPINYPDLEDPKVLFTDTQNKRIYTTPFNIDIADQQRTTLTINVGEASLCNDNILFKNLKLRFFIICPYQLWQLESSVVGESLQRPNAIISELLNIFNKPRKGAVGLGKNNFTRLYNTYPNQQVGGFCLELEAVDFVVNG